MKINIKTMRVLQYRAATVAAILLLAIFSSNQASAATSAGPLKTEFGWKYNYDKQGRIISATDPAKKRTNIRYAKNKSGTLGSITRELPNGSKVRVKFDKKGRRTEMVDSAGTVRYAYDRLGRLSKVHREGSPIITYEYDTHDRIKSMKVGTKFTLQYTYDYLGRPKKINTPAGNVLFSYNSKTNEVTRRLPNGIITRWVYGPDSHLKSLVHTHSGNRSLAQYQYAYRLDDLITSIKELTPSGVQTKNYNYDSAQRLISVSDSDQNRIDYTYDKLGSRTKIRTQNQRPISARFDWMGRLTNYDGQPCQHDPAGNLTSCTGNAKSFAFDDTGLLKTAAMKNGKVDYRYDGDGYLISRNDEIGKQTFVPNPLSDIWQPLVVKNSEGQQTFYIWDGTLPLMAITEKQVSYFLHDHLGSVRLVTDKRGDVFERLNYTPFGQPEKRSAGMGLKPGFAGLFFDKATSVYLTRARAYDPELGRFLQPDPQHRVPTGSQKDLSVYAYCGGDPVNYVDLNGAEPVSLNSSDVWWDAFGRSLTHNSAIDRGPTERESVIDEVLNNARSKARIDLKRSGIPITNETLHATANDIVNQWRGEAYRSSEAGKGMFAKTSYYKQFPDATPVAPHEWQISETMTEVYDEIITGKNHPMFKGSLDIPEQVYKVAEKISIPRYQVNAVVLDLKEYAWEKIRIIGERSNPKGWGALGRPNNVDQYRLPPDLFLTAFAGHQEKLDTDTINQSSKLSRIRNKLVRVRDKAVTMRDMSTGKITVPGWLSQTPERDKYYQKARAGAIEIMEISSGSNQSKIGSIPQIKNLLSWDAKPAYAGPIGGQHSKVGGIRLTGAGNALNRLGGLEGIALDETNDRLILIGKDKETINLPPLRLDDLVTVFRSVYQHGEAPSVSIDPISDSETEKFMTVRHGAATENTYVGWVLYEADRIMKSYQLGKDNKTKKTVYSRAPAYRDFYETSRVSWKGIWERFWIVPASQTRRQGSTSELTILDVPLKLETERMEWENGKLVTAKRPTPSKPAAAFQKWFTTQYKAIARETKLKPPKHCGFKEPVAVFEELQRIALMTGIAETLRDQNVPFPSWMNDYPVKPCISDRQTPILRVQKKYTQLTGGVQLSAADSNVHVHKDDQRVTRLARTVKTKVAAKPLFSSVSFDHDGETYNSVTLPGANTQRTGANVLQHTDLTAPMVQGSGIKLTRHFNSFYEPRGIFGRGWTFDHPKLEPQKQPVKRDGRSITYKTVYQLSSPLNSWSERFAEVGSVPELNGQLMVPSSSKDMLGLSDSNLQIIGQKTKELIFRDGRSWHFDQDGYMVAHADQEKMVVYQRDRDHKITSIKSFNITNNRVSSGALQADVQLTYDDQQNRLRSIEAKSPKSNETAKALYFYDEAGQLVMVIGSDGKREYAYRNGLVAGITQDGERLASYEYNKQGQIKKERRSDGKRVAYERTTTSYGTKVVALDTETQKPVETIEYDSSFQPLSRTLEDGSKIAWNRQEKMLETTVTQPDGQSYTITEDKEKRQSTIKTSAGATYVNDFDAEGRLTSSISDDQGVLNNYSRNGKLSSTIIAPADQARGNQIKQFVKTSYDTQERVTSVSDDSGSQLQIEYDQSGQPSVIRSQRGAVRIDRNAKGQVEEIGTTWGFTEKYDYNKNTGNLSRVVFKQQSGSAIEEASIELTDGLITKIKQADGAETTMNYFRKGSKKGLLKKVQTTEKLNLDYGYDSLARLTSIDIGDSDTPAYRLSYEYDSQGRLAGISYTLASNNN